MAVTGKLLTLKAKSELFLGVQKAILKAVNTDIVFREINDPLSSSLVDENMEFISAAVDLCFPDISDEWNELQDKISNLGNKTANVLINYNENLSTIKGNSQFKNSFKNEVYQIVTDSEVLNSKISSLGLDIRNKIAVYAVNNDKRLRSSFK